MKAIAVAFILPVLFSCSGKKDKVQVGEMTTMEVNEVFDAGTVVKGETIRAVFTVKNTGDAPLVISEVRPSCSCTVADKPEDPIAPGASAEIVAKVETENVSSKSVTKTVTLVTNTEESTKVLSIKAKIK
ncbi:MAG: DUF1573 domain-containing protein [Flavobacteriia bacterium]|nr:DUF1573 domain-containing protein [Flavobacteriia bacterium]